MEKRFTKLLAALTAVIMILGLLSACGMQAGEVSELPAGEKLSGMEMLERDSREDKWIPDNPVVEFVFDVALEEPEEEIVEETEEETEEVIEVVWNDTDDYYDDSNDYQESYEKPTEQVVYYDEPVTEWNGENNGSTPSHEPSTVDGYGCYGRFEIPEFGFGIALDEVWYYDTPNQAYWQDMWYCEEIADHNYDGFTVLYSAYPGMKARIVQQDGSVRNLTCVRVDRNATWDNYEVRDCNGVNPFTDPANYGMVIARTCNSSQYSDTLVFFVED